MASVTKSGGEIFLSASGLWDVEALADGRFVVVVNAPDADSTGVFAQFYDAGGVKGSSVRVNAIEDNIQSFAAVSALHSGGFAAAWSDSSNEIGSGQDIGMQLISASGSRSGSEKAANTTILSSQFMPAVATLTNGNYVVAWTDHSHTHGDPENDITQFRIFSSSGVQVVSEKNVSNDGFSFNDDTRDTNDPQLAALSNGNFVVTWRQQDNHNGPSDDSFVHGQIFSKSGVAVGAEFIATSEANDAVATGLGSGTLVMAYTNWDNDALNLQRVSASGAKAGSELTVTATGHGGEDAALATLKDGRFVVGWTDNDLSTSEQTIKGAIYNANGTLSVAAFTVNTTSVGAEHLKGVSVLEDGRIVFSWSILASGGDAAKTGAYAQIVDPRTAAAHITGSNTLADHLVGTSHGDIFKGQGGRDVLDGGLGNDKLTGGKDNDFFVFDSKLNKSSNVDHITDFSHGHDKIELNHTIFTGLGDHGALASKYFYAHASGHDKDDHILYDKSHGKLYFDADGKGGHTAVLFAVIDGHHTLSASDFTIV